jgi:hypothetical protein
MGNRSSIIITSEQFPNPIYLYGHWSGDDNVRAVRNVLARTTRVGDPNYLTAQIFYEFAINLGSYDGELSFGIGTYPTDTTDWDDNPPVHINADTGEVTETYDPPTECECGEPIRTDKGYQIEESICAINTEFCNHHCGCNEHGNEGI